MFYQRQLIGCVHAAGHIHQKHQIGRRQFFKRQILRFNADFDDLGVRLPRRIDGIGVHRKRRAALRQRIAVVEIVNQFFHPHRIHRRQAAIIEEAAAVGIAAGVDINAEGRHRLLRHGMHGVGADLAVLLGVLQRQRDFSADGRRGHHRHAHTSCASISSIHGLAFGGLGGFLCGRGITGCGRPAASRQHSSGDNGNSNSGADGSHDFLLVVMGGLRHSVGELS